MTVPGPLREAEQNTKRYLRAARLLLILTAVALLLSGCGQEKSSGTAVTPLPVPTADPTVSSGTRTLEEALISRTSAALQLETRVLQENSAIASARVPDQILNQFLDALRDEKAWTQEQGRYTLTASSGGNFVYDKPYSELITGSSTDVYTIEDETGWVEEIVDNTRYDPFTWVMSGEGGGAFAYMSVYSLEADASAGSVETVSRLNDAISGWSSDAFTAADGHYRFIDLQLSPDAEGAIEAPYTWVLCIGDISADSAKIEEFTLMTEELRLPLDGLSLSMTADALSQQAERLGQRLSLMTLSKGEISYYEYRQ